MEGFLTESEALFEQVKGWRRTIHSQPELSFEERETSRFIASVLRSEGIDFRAVAGTGLLARIEGTAGPSRRAVVMRADIDALPIREESGVEFASRNDGVMHACGHDMHAATLLGALKIVRAHRNDFAGTVLGLFQPGEELNPGGASIVLAEKPFEGYDIAGFVGQHIDPELPTGLFGFREGQYMASSDELRFTIRGVGGHGAMRRNIKDPVLAAAEFIVALHAIQPALDPANDPPLVLSVGRVTANGATNVIPDEVYIEGTLRAFDEGLRARAKEMIAVAADTIGAKYDVTILSDISTGYPCVVNDSRLTRLAADTVRQRLGDENVRMLELRPTAEDFGFYTRLYPAVFYRCGVGSDSLSNGFGSATSAGKLHTSHLCPNENALRLSPAIMAETALKILSDTAL